MGLDFFRLEDLTPSSSSAFSSSSAESDMCYGQSLLTPGEWIITKETPKVDGTMRTVLLSFRTLTSPSPSGRLAPERFLTPPVFPQGGLSG